ncbi:hypothetical protein [Nitrosomonas mobilis]|uniref:Uncharacterized protein n=1 Tax=Nitrosomonas mobilis TaxID=51642 RepID=A0A1G5SCR3_9PROT|nr:hypothetical protein [Nitrosomonas mobilis]SCZ84331.1 hypothetical protein NSMM_150069 [Nitrosomonas mobilis]HNO74383.1 hypothetical protein [Nitrosomonas mobilis]
MIFLSTDKTLQEVKKHYLDSLARRNLSSHSVEKQADPDKVTVRTQESSLPDAQWHRSKTARFSRY